MYKPFITKRKTNVTLLAALLLMVGSSSAEKFDVQQEIKISSSRQAADLKNKIFSYIDNVIISQGTLTIHAELVQVISQAPNDDKIYIAKGSPATFAQTLQDGSPINLQANEIRYEPSKNIVVISGNALLRQEGSEVSGSKITYNFETEYVNAESLDNAKVETVLQPKNNGAAKPKDKQE
ncbi:lipopolysaccharide export system protein LptA [Colwellia chukchiensis]|uniref:Lipopolysaccharide export system protein LptA n=1 Tax=Colwellia chukchiensis TaxID=641665 RepID=A0A1H7LGH1_9GAMM|nr:lipopolysaccharide transport periplasmic protein LptA [Colwellia chukchiensis]SEK97909.1 lipopolysaccharide export system protein LptA [Colwellia chukchiensis]